MKLLILAGGAGTRLWPVSRQNQPKQVQPFIEEQTLLQKTYYRLLSGFDQNDIYISTGKDLVEQIKAQLPQLKPENLIAEPARRDKAPAIGLAALILNNLNPESSLTTIWSDHHIKNVGEYIRILRLLKKILEEHPKHTVMIGIKPIYPEIGYGYIKIDGQTGNIGEDKIFKVEKFIEKPDLETAKEFIAQWDYLWNPGIFAWKTKYLLELYREFLPEVYERLQVIKKTLGANREQAVIEKEFAAMPSVEIENGILEKTKDILVVPASFGWADIGHWKTVQEILSDDTGGNVVKGNHINIDSSGNLIYSYSKRLIATAGVKDMIIIDTEDVILVCPKDSSQDVKKIVNKLKEKGMERYL